MSNSKPAAIGGYVLNANPDIPDVRDWPYQPSLQRLSKIKAPPSNLHILDQGQEGACTGFGLAAVVNLLKQQTDRPEHVSARMLYEMAKRHDEWSGEEYAGSSCRGAIKGWSNMGVCSEALWQYHPTQPGSLSVDAAKAARSTTLGAYYRIQHRISDFHAALNEVDAIYVSANVHNGWRKPRKGVIDFAQTDSLGAHAFAIVGYNESGFWVQNSWGTKWGRDGLALWRYEDWLENINDAWVLQLALPTPQIAHLSSGANRTATTAAEQHKPARREIAGHFVHVDDGQFHGRGRYWSSLDDLKTTATNLRSTLETQPDKYQHLLIYAHGGLNTPHDSATRIAAWKELFKANGIYPFHFMYDTGLVEELKDVVLRRGAAAQQRAGSFSLSSMTDWLLERATRSAGRALWREMKAGAATPFKPKMAGDQVIKSLILPFSGQTSSPMKLHLVGHSTGGILIAHLLDRLRKASKSRFEVESVSLLAPATSVSQFEMHYRPWLKSNKTNGTRIKHMRVFNLADQQELDDSVAVVYRKSLLYLVSRAFEERPPEAILGMQKYSKALEPSKALDFIYSAAKPAKPPCSTSMTHGGFDNDLATMNSVLRIVLGTLQPPHQEFEKRHLTY